MVRLLVAALGVAAAAGGLAPGAASAAGGIHTSIFPGYLYLLPPPVIHPALGTDFVAQTNMR